MAGTDRKQSATLLTPAPAIILARPQLGENIGMCARAMLNCGVTELRIVAPRDGWPNPDAVSAASGAIEVLENARLFDTVAQAVCDLECVFATTARPRDMVKDIYTAGAAARRMREVNAASLGRGGGNACGILFGPERTGLDNDEVALAGAIVSIPLNPGFSSLNLSQAVLLACHAWLSADNPFADGREEVETQYGATAPATRGDIENLMAHLEDELEAHGFFRSPEKRPTLMRNIRNFFFRSGLTRQEAQTLHGVFSCLTGKKSWK